MSETKQHEMQFDVIGSIANIRNSSLNLHLAMQEFIDNSIDANATNIKIVSSGGNLTIEDDGDGFNDFHNAVIVGKSIKQNEKLIGRHGVGMKAAAIKFSNTTILQSNDRYMVMPWNSILEGMIEPIFEENKCDPIKGTRITLIDFDSLRSTRAVQPTDLAKTYAMLLHYKKVAITYNGELLQMPALPKYVDSINEQIEWRGKRSIVRGGTYATNDPARRNWSGYYAYYNGRLIQGKILDCGRGDLTCSNFVYHIYMNDEGQSKWNLSTHKDEVHDLTDFIEHLYTVYTQQHLEKASNESEVIELKEIEDFVTDAANGKTLRNSTRSKGDKQGTVEKVGTGRRQINTNQHNCPGEYIPNNAGKSQGRPPEIRFHFESMGSLTLGTVEKAKGNRRIWKFNKDNRFVDKYKSDKRVIAPLMICFKELLDKADNHELFADDLINDALERTGEHLDATVENYD